MIREPAILLVEDEPDIADLLSLHLADLGYRVDAVADGALGLQKALATPYALIILDLMLPGMSGTEVCQHLRERQRTTPILMLTAKSEERDKVIGLDLGADDYVTKPFSIRELLARVRALLRRVELDQPEEAPAEIVLGDLVIEPAKRKVQVAGASVELTAKEFDLLNLFAQHPGRAFSRQELLDKVWGYQYAGYSHTVNSHINRLRSKIEPDPSTPRYVQTVWGVGYRFAEEEDLAHQSTDA
jgi:two-component system alkaline phosphatase synthesis response regulator PhoP